MRGKILAWVLHNVPLGSAAPWVFGLMVGRWPHKQNKQDKNK